jgi:putative flippase GtrA
MMLSAMAKKNSIQRTVKFALCGFSLFFIGMLLFIVVYDALTGASSETTTEYCAKYGFLASPKCW